MMFKRELARLIVEGEKTATRRGPVVGNPRAMWRVERPWRYPVGKVFTVNPGRGVAAVAECVVTRRYMQPLSCVEHADAVKEGFRTGDGMTARAAFLAALQKINKRLDLSETVHVVEFNLCGPGCMHCDGCGWCEGSPAWTCTRCFGTGFAPSPAALEMIRRLDREAAAA